MKPDDDLTTIAREIKALEDRFVSGDSLGLFLPAEQAADYRRLVMEAKSIIDAELGYLNDFCTGLVLTANSRGAVSGGPPKARVMEARKLIEGAVNHIRRKPGFSDRQLPAGQPVFVSVSRLAELRASPKLKWDALRLVRLCEELNVCFANGCFMAAAMLVRSITDHVPPVFGLRDFGEVANNYAGSQSFKASMKQLHGSLRHIADAHLHVQIRNTEALPSERQVAFQADLDVLLGEVVRLIK